MAENGDVIEYLLTMLWRHRRAFTRKLTGFETTIAITRIILKLNSWDFRMTWTIVLLKLLMSSNSSLWVTVSSLWRSKDQRIRFIIGEIWKLIKSLILRFRHRNLMLSLNYAMMNKSNIAYVCFYWIYLWGNFFYPFTTDLGLSEKLK